MILLGYLVTLIMYSDFRPPRGNKDTLFCKETKEEGKKNACKTNQDFSNQVCFSLQFTLSVSFSKIWISINVNDKRRCPFFLCVVF